MCALILMSGVPLSELLNHLLRSLCFCFMSPSFIPGVAERLTVRFNKRLTERHTTIKLLKFELFFRKTASRCNGRIE